MAGDSLPARDDAAEAIPTRPVVTDHAHDSRTARLDDDEVAADRDPLLGPGRRDRETSEVRSGWRKPSALWIMIPSVILAILSGGTLSTEIEVYNQVACRLVPLDRLPPLLPVIHPTRFTEQTNAVARWSSSTPLSSDRTGVDSVVPVASDEDWEARCRKSSEVQMLTTEFITYLMMISGIAGTFTSGWWGTMSDRHGRLPIFAILSVAEFIQAISTILLVCYPDELGVKWAYTGGIFRGLFGGDYAWSNLAGAYLSDTVGTGSKSSVFSLLEATTFVGFCLGPILGALAYSLTNFLPIAHVGKLIFFTIFFFNVLFFMPESLSTSRKADQRRLAKEEERKRLLEEEAWSARGRSVIVLRLRRLVRAPLEVLRPLKVLLPREVAQVGQEEDRPMLAPKRTFVQGRKDWNLTLVAVSYALFNLVTGITAVQLVYARGKFDWGPTETGGWITFDATTRLVMLLLILPFGLKALRKSAPTPSTPRPSGDDEEPTAEQQTWDLHAAHLVTLADSQFDLLLAKFSICFALLGYLIMSIPKSTSYLFLLGTAFISLSAATSPALQSLAVALSSPREAGKVIASLSALATISIQLVAPPFFAQVYVLVVDWLPEFIFLLAVIWILLSLVPTFGVHLYDDELDEEEETWLASDGA